MDSDFSSSDDDVDDINFVAHLGRPRRVRVYRNRCDHFLMWDDIDFYNRFRLSKQVVNCILDLIKHKIQSTTNWNNAVTPAQQILLTMRFLASGAMLIGVGDFIGIHKSTACKYIWRVLQAIAGLRTMFIHLKNDAQSIQEKQKGFFDISRFPKVIGALDCTHVRVQSPGGDNAEIYRNRKGFFSINVQAICDYNLRFSDVVARWQGSAHDSTIFNNSKIQAKFINGLFGDCILLGDGGYALKSYCITPIQNPEGAVENLFNESQIRTRNPIERAFGVWKRRFPVLSLGIRLKTNKVQCLIVVAAILHNIAIDCKESEPPPLSHAMEDAIFFVNNVHNTNLAGVDRNFNERNEYLSYFESLLNARNNAQM